VTREQPEAGIVERTQRLHELKSHIPLPIAKNAIEEGDAMLNATRAFVVCN
jgi:hypothetical protein